VVSSSAVRRACHLPKPLGLITSATLGGWVLPPPAEAECRQSHGLLHSASDLEWCALEWVVLCVM
jgi:hypothetical protein